MRVNSLVATEEDKFWFGDIGCPIPVPPMPDARTVELIEKLEDGLEEPVLTLQASGILDYKDEANFRKYVALSFLRWSLVKVKKLPPVDGEHFIPRRRNVRPTVVAPDLEAIPQNAVGFEPDDFDEEEPRD